MRIYLLAFSVAVLSSAYWPCLGWATLSWRCPPFIPQLASSFLVLGAWCLYRRRCPFFVRVSVVFVIGMVWAALWGEWMKARQLPLTQDKTDFVLLGVVSGVPQSNTARTRFVVEIESLEPLNASSVARDKGPDLQRVMLSWYGGEPVRPGERWQLTVRLRTPRGFANPGGFDYAGWLFQRQISATGYVRARGVNKKLAQTTHYSIDQFRWAVREKIETLDFSATSRGLLAALTLGEKQGLDSATWMHMRLTGTVHLAVVSGLHIGMVAGLGLLLGRLLGRCLGIFAPVSVPQSAVLFGGGLALIYALLAGFSLSTQRALLMLLVFLLASLLKRKLRPELGLLWALALIAASEPLAALSSGFWLSFVAVATFLMWFVPRPRGGYLRDLCTAQLIIFLPLAGLLSLFQGEISLLSPLVNLLAIPWLGIAVVPLALFGMLLLPLSSTMAGAVWGVAAWQLEAFGRVTGWLSTYADYFVWSPPAGQAVLLSVAILFAGALMLTPKGLGLRAMTLVLLLAVALSGQSFLQRRGSEPSASLGASNFTLAVLDVGQGLSVVAINGGSAVVYDTGPKYSDSFNAGSGIIAPYLRSQGVSAVDVLMLSHGDTDHVGGTAGLLEHFKPLRILAGQPDELRLPTATVCSRGQRFFASQNREKNWTHAGVSFEILYPEPHKPPAHVSKASGRLSDNDSSCVLLIRYRDKTILLPGDISVEVEAQLLARGVLPQHVDVLIAPHHGSRTSSSRAFVDYLSPTHVVYSAGFNHHFGHPAKQVAARYRAIGSYGWVTGASGAIIFKWSDAGELSVHPQRSEAARYWH